MCLKGSLQSVESVKCLVQHRRKELLQFPNPTTAVSSAAVTKLANNTGNLVKTGFTFAGWNTAADGSGTAYSGYGYATPLLRYVASDYDTSTKVWANSGSAGNSFNITNRKYTLTLTQKGVRMHSKFEH